MKKIHVEVCVCTACVMNGSVDLMESVESLRELRGKAARIKPRNRY